MKSLVALGVLTFLSLSGSTSLASTIELNPRSYHHITFEDIKATEYSFDQGTLEAKVESSSSVLLKAFNEKRKVRKVSFQWQSLGKLKIKDAEHESEKSGDDARLRIGLLQFGKAPTVPFFAPAWIKKTRDVLKLPSDKMIYLVAGAQHPAKARWESPYSSSISNISLPSKQVDGSWQMASITFDKPIELVGIWILADGDNTESSFTSKLRNLRLE